MDNKHLNVDDIINKEFKVKMRGYDTVEVDYFLDLIIEDYNQYENELALLRKEVLNLRKQLDNQSSIAPSQEESVGTTNYDILRRISNLEKHVFGVKLDV